MRLDIQYVTRFTYAKPVVESQNELRACPATDEHQQLLHYDVTISPAARIASYIDYWGTRVDTFGIRSAHTHLEVVAQATVDTDERGPLPENLRYSQVTERAFADRHFPYLQRSPHVDWSPEIAREAQAIVRAAGDDYSAVVRQLHDRVAGLEYRPGSTYVGVSVDKVFRVGGGVCQDFAHLAVAMYRASGIPARYVSGYLFTADDSQGTDTTDDEVRVQTHAWVEVATPDHTWFAFDPTNRQPVGVRHVTIGRGRDYDDVAPLRGVFSGAADHDMSVEVTMRRLSASTPMPSFNHRMLATTSQQQMQQQQ